MDVKTIIIGGVVFGGIFVGMEYLSTNYPAKPAESPPAHQLVISTPTEGSGVPLTAATSVHHNAKTGLTGCINFDEINYQIDLKDPNGDNSGLYLVTTDPLQHIINKAMAAGYSEMGGTALAGVRSEVRKAIGWNADPAQNTVMDISPYIPLKALVNLDDITDRTLKSALEADARYVAYNKDFPQLGTKYSADSLRAGLQTAAGYKAVIIKGDLGNSPLCTDVKYQK